MLFIFISNSPPIYITSFIKALFYIYYRPIFLHSFFKKCRSGSCNHVQTNLRTIKKLLKASFCSHEPKCRIWQWWKIGLRKIIDKILPTEDGWCALTSQQTLWTSPSRAFYSILAEQLIWRPKLINGCNGRSSGICAQNQKWTYLIADGGRSG